MGHPWRASHTRQAAPPRECKEAEAHGGHGGQRPVHAREVQPHAVDAAGLLCGGAGGRGRGSCLATGLPGAPRQGSQSAGSREPVLCGGACVWGLRSKDALRLGRLAVNTGKPAPWRRTGREGGQPVSVASDEGAIKIDPGVVPVLGAGGEVAGGVGWVGSERVRGRGGREEEHSSLANNIPLRRVLWASTAKLAQRHGWAAQRQASGHGGQRGTRHRQHAGVEARASPCCPGGHCTH